jgi:hypothetical protein
MSSIVLTDAKVFVGQYDFSTRLNRVGLDYKAEPLNDTRFGHTTEVNVGGTKSVTCAVAGFGEEGTGLITGAMFDRIGISGKPFSTGPQGNSAGDVMYTFDALTAKMAPFGGQHGQLLPFSGEALGDGSPLVRGYLVAPKAARTASSNSGTALELGAVSATQRVYAALHIFTVSGTNPTIDVIVQSDDGLGFGTPTTRVTFAQAIAAGSEWQSAAGAITDTFWRVSWSIGGTDPSFTFAVVVGII